MKKLSFFLMAMLFSVMSFAAESLLVTLDFSKNTWKFPVASANKTTATVSYTNGDYAITLAGGGNGNGHYYNNDGYLIFGKSGATLTLPAFDFKTTKIVVTGRSGASASVLQNIYVGSTAVSTQTKGAAVTNTYAIAEDYQAAGNVYVLKVTSSHNTQIVKMEIYGEEGGEQGEKVDAPTFSVTETNFNKAFDLTISSAEGTTLKYTTDNTDPKTSVTAVSVETNTANVSIPAKSTAVKAVAVKGDLVSVTYSIVYAYVNSAETAYTVAEAMEVIDAGLGLDNELYIKGTISKIENFNSQYGSITYWIEDEEGNEFECYSGLGLNKAKFTSIEDVEVGASVVACGVMKLFVTSSGDKIYEFNYNNYLVEYVAPVTEPEIEWMEMDLEITNLVTEVMEVGGAKFLQLMGRDDMNDADVTLFLNNYADVDDDYLVNAESSYMTFGGTELTVLEGTMTQTSETEKGTIYTGTVRASAEEEGETMYIEFTLTMYAAPATVLVLTDAIVAINEELGTLTFNVPTGEDEGYYAELAGYTAPGVHQGPQICLFSTPEVVSYTNYAETSVADGIITLKGEFTSPMGPKFDLTISGTLPVVEPEVIAYELNGGELVVEVPTQEELWASFKTAAGLTTLGTLAEMTEAGAGKPHNDPNNPCACRIICARLLDANVNAVFALPEWAWLKAYIMTVQSGLPEASNVSWRYAFAAFFLQSQHSAYPASADFTEAGKPENWGPAYQATHAVVLPTEPVDAPYTLPTPVKEGYKFVGWYDNAEGKDEPYTVIPAGWSGTLYAIWEAEGPATALDNIAIEGKVVKTIINGQLIIIKNGVQYNAQGQVIK